MTRNIYFKTTSLLGIEVTITKLYWEFITTHKHPVILGKEKLVQEALKDPTVIKSSQKDSKVVLYYLPLKEKFLCVVVKQEKRSGFIITTYITDKIKEGKIIWTK